MARGARTSLPRRSRARARSARAAGSGAARLSTRAVGSAERRADAELCAVTRNQRRPRPRSRAARAAASPVGSRGVALARDDPSDEQTQRRGDADRTSDAAAAARREYPALSSPHGPAQSGANGRRGAFRPLPLGRSEEHTSELQSLMRTSYAV